MILGAAAAFWFLPNVPACLLLMLPLVLDGVIQLKTAYESTNLRRFLTGVLFGYALISLLVIFAVTGYRQGYAFAANLKLSH